MKYSYEGEGSYLGVKTLFMKYPEDKLPNIQDIKSNVHSVYINTNDFTDELNLWIEYWLSYSNRRISIEFEKFPIIVYTKILYNPALMLFCSVDEFVPDLAINMKRDFVKIRVLSSDQLDRCIKMATEYIEQGYNNVLLMPEYDYDNMNKILMDNYDKIHPGVRFMPPVQNLLKID